MKYNKLVRDNILEILNKKGERYKAHIACDVEYWEKLKEKLKEEVDEFIQESNEEELADILEVINFVCEFKNFNEGDIKKIRDKKLKEKGGFLKRIVLDEVIDN